MKKLIPILTLVSVAVVLSVPALTLTSCNGPGSEQSPGVLEALRQQVDSERERRTSAESAALTEARLRRRWELATAATVIIAVSGFIAGTALGSRGRRHHEAAA